MPARTTRFRSRRLSLELLEDRRLLSVVIGVDAAANLQSISPLIYGVNFGTASDLADLGATFNRNGGNAATRYNWQLNADNRANDYFYESIGDTSSVAGERGDTFIADTQAAGAQTELTMPMIDWVAKLGPGRSKLASFSVAKYGPQQQTDPFFPDAGNGVQTNGQNVMGNDPNDANVPNSPQFEKGWVQHLVSKWGTADEGGLRYYGLDNEASIWFATHRDVAPTGLTMDQMLNKIVSYASMIKSVDPSALVLGPEEWGWDGYLYSGADQQYSSQHPGSPLPDRAAHNNMDYIPWLLQQLQQQQTSTGQRLLDVLTVHYYPQGDQQGHDEFSNDVSTATQLLRNRSTRSLWDPNYVDQSWIQDKVDLIPRLKNWVSTYYPGTPVGLTEYNWGAEDHMNGATTQADVLGILGREGVDLASRWVAPAQGTPTYNAYKLYRNYDNQHSTFGDTSVSTTVPNPDQVSAFSAVRSSDGALTIMVVNKNLYDPTHPSATTSLTLDLSNFANLGTAQEWQLYAPNPTDMTTSVIAQKPDVSFTGSSFSVNVPMQSVTLFVLQPAAATAPSHPGTLSFASAEVSVAESSGSITLTVVRSGGSDGTITAHFSTQDATARAGIDYVPTSGTLTFLPGETTKTITVPLLNDPTSDGTETLTVALDSPTGGATVSEPTAVLTISDSPPMTNPCMPKRRPHHRGMAGQTTCHVIHHRHHHHGSKAHHA
jgi:hypothetical protein